MASIETPETSSTERRHLRAIAAALVSYGVVTAVCWAVTREHSSVSGAPWAFGLAMGTSAVYVAFGLALGIAGHRSLRIARIVVGSLLVAALISPTLAGLMAETPNELIPGLDQAGLGPALTVVSAALFLSLLFGRPKTVRTALSFAGLGLVASLLVAMAGVLVRRPVLRGPAVAFEILRIDDDAEILGDVDLPANVHVVSEKVEGRLRPFLRVVAPPGTPFDVATKQAELAIGPHVHPPEGTRLVWQREPDAPALVLRTYVVRGPPIVTSADVESAEVLIDEPSGRMSIAVHMRTSAAERFRDVTRESVGRRLAVSLDGAIQMAAVVKSEIVGGNVELSLDPGTTRGEAEALVAGIRGELLHGP